MSNASILVWHPGVIHMGDSRKMLLIIAVKVLGTYNHSKLMHARGSMWSTTQQASYSKLMQSKPTPAGRLLLFA